MTIKEIVDRLHAFDGSMEVTIVEEWKGADLHTKSYRRIESIGLESTDGQPLMVIRIKG